MMASNKTAILWAILAAALYALNSPVSKLLLGEIPPTMMAALLYLGAGIGLTVVRLAQRLDDWSHPDDGGQRLPAQQL